MEVFGGNSMLSFQDEIAISEAKLVPVDQNVLPVGEVDVTTTSVNTKIFLLEIKMCSVLRKNRRFIDKNDLSCYSTGRSGKRTGIILITPNKDVVVVKNKMSGIWGLPKGKINAYDKSLATSASRELLEETGLNLLPNKFNSFTKVFNKTHYYVMAVSFSSDIAFKPRDTLEVAEVRLIPIGNIPTLAIINRGLLEFYHAAK